MPPPDHKRAKEIVVVQEIGSGATEGSRKRRKSIVSPSPKLNANASPKVNSGVEVNDHAATNGSPRTRKPNGAANGIGSRGMSGIGFR